MLNSRHTAVSVVPWIVFTFLKAPWLKLTSPNKPGKKRAEVEKVRVREYRRA